ncbi:hypothetical protein J4481_02760 [Candidatus Pacearchaeota archaeon]|nr:hypothetical protein [Candidatus Pacearchaeota archaeon]
MNNTIKEQIAMGLFTGAVIAFFIFLGEIGRNFLKEILVLSALILTIFLSLIILLNPTDLHIFGNIFKIKL